MSKAHSTGMRLLFGKPKKSGAAPEKDRQSFLGISSGGHFTKNENYEQGMRREFSEELGITLPASAFKGLAKLRLSHPNHYGMNNSFFRLFLVQQDIPLEKFRIDPKELEDIKYFTKTELADLLSRQDTMARTSKALLEKYIFPII
jgi:NADH pyrophosphatase NudC (nudix superfamily)